LSPVAGERMLAKVRAAAGHTNIAVTSIYLHVALSKIRFLPFFARST
jgi:hypothetical protein